MTTNIGARSGTTVRGAGDVIRGHVLHALDPETLEATGDLTATLAAKTQLRATLQATAELRCAFPTRGIKKRVVITDGSTSTVLGEIENARIGSFHRELNRPDTWTFVMHASDPKAALVLPEIVGGGQAFREAQLWRGDRLLTWGPIVRPSVTGDDDLAVTVHGADWHLTRRTIGHAERENLLTNPSFEDGLAGWNTLRHAGSDVADLSFVLSSPEYPEAYARGVKKSDGHPVKTGTRSMQLIDVSEDGKRPFTFQEVEVTTGEVAETFTFTAYCWIPSTGFEEPNPRDTGLLLGALPVDYRDLNYPGTGAPLPHSGYGNMFWAARLLDFFALDFAKFGTPPDHNRWQRLECSIVVPPNQNVLIAARFECPVGTGSFGVYFDDAWLVRSEALHFVDADQTSEIASALVWHLQGKDDTGADDPTLDKSDVNIVPSCRASGVTRDRSYYFSEHPNGFEALSEFFALRDGFDYGMTYTTSERRFTTYSPEKGRYVRKLALRYDRNVSAFAWTFDGERAASSIIILGEGRGDGREEGSAIDSVFFAGGLTLEEVIVAPEGTDRAALDELAAEHLAAGTNPEVLTLSTRPDPRGLPSSIDGPDLISLLDTGDYIDVRIEKGVFVLTGVYRVAAITLPEAVEGLDLVLNRRSSR